MTEQLFSLVAPDGKVLAQVKVAPGDDGWMLGKIIADSLPEEMRKAFRWHEEVANDQLFSFLDEAEDAIERLGLGVLSPDERSVQRVYDLQIMNGDDVAFRFSKRQVPGATGALDNATIPTEMGTGQPPAKRI